MDREINCPNCNVSLTGELIYETFIKNGYTPEKALQSAEMYGATKTTGRWDKRIGIYDITEDRVTEWKCKECNHRWKR